MKRAHIASLLLIAAPAFAQEPEPLCTDRPSKANAVCTVPAGTIQIETDLLSWSRTSGGGMREDMILCTNPTVKLGLGANTDIQVNIAPLAETRIRTSGGHLRTTGVGDLYVRVKQRLTDPSAPVQIGLLPYVKAPVAKRGIGNGAWEGGLAVPISVELPNDVLLTFGPEADALADEDGSGRHVQLIGLVNIARQMTPKLNLGAELWTSQDYDPAGTVRQYSADVAASYLLKPLLQLDFGGNFGLNHQTADVQLYVGFSTRF